MGDEERREDFYERLAQFARTLAIGLSTADWINDARNEASIASYKEDLRRFQKLRTAVRKRYQEDIDFKLYEERVRKLLDQHIHANEVVTLTAPVNIFDDKAFEEAVGEQATPASKADMIASLTQRTINERMEQDPVYFEKISTLIQKAIDDHRAQRISQLEFLNIVRDARDQVVRPRHDDVPNTCAATTPPSPSITPSKSISRLPMPTEPTCRRTRPRPPKPCSIPLPAAAS
ncbi:type I restriction enzyme endonuclease domain-containing protein [Mesorhizobium sp. ORM8.1]